MKENKTRKEKFLEAMDIPIELLSDISRITMISNELIYIENYKGIIEYDDNLIRLTNKVTVLGQSLCIEEISNNEVFISGKINNIEFES